MAPSLHEVCPKCGSHLGMNPNCENCQEHATAGADRETAKVGGVTAAQTGEPRAFSSSGRVD
jgi:hypothetical protein